MTLPRRLLSPVTASTARALGLLGLALLLAACDGPAQSTSAPGNAARPAVGMSPSSSSNTASNSTTSDAVFATAASPAQPGPSAGATPASTQQPPASNSAALADAAGDEFDAALRAPIFRPEPDANLSAYTRFSVEPVAIQLAPSASPAIVSPDDLKTIADALRTHLIDNLGESMTLTDAARPADTNTKPTGPTMTLRCTIARLAPKVDPSAPTGLSGLLFTHAACRIDVVDSSSNRLLATFLDASTPARLIGAARAGSDDAARATRTDDELARSCLRQWSEQFAQRLDQSR